MYNVCVSVSVSVLTSGYPADRTVDESSTNGHDSTTTLASNNSSSSSTSLSSSALVCTENISPQKEPTSSSSFMSQTPSPCAQLPATYVAQEEAVLKEFSAFLRRTVDMLHKNGS